MNLLVTGAFDWTECELEELRKLGHNVFFMQQEKDELPCDASLIDGIIGNGVFLYHTIKKFSSLKYVQLTSAGFDRVPMEYINTHNIRIFNAKGVYSIPMAEFAIGGVLQLYKQSAFFMKNKELHKWGKNRSLKELFGKNVCIVGCGSVGNECAKRFLSFGCRTIGIDLYPYQNEFFEDMLSIDKIDDMLPYADVVVLTLPLTNESRGLMNSKRFSLMKKGAVIVNIARGAIIETESLITALDSHLFGAVIDVFEEEPLGADHKLWDLNNTIISPHNSFVSEANHARMFELIMNNLKGN